MGNFAGKEVISNGEFCWQRGEIERCQDERELDPKQLLFLASSSLKLVPEEP